MTNLLLPDRLFICHFLMLVFQSFYTKNFEADAVWSTRPVVMFLTFLGTVCVELVVRFCSFFIGAIICFVSPVCWIYMHRLLYTCVRRKTWRRFSSTVGALPFCGRFMQRSLATIASAISINRNYSCWTATRNAHAHAPILLPNLCVCVSLCVYVCVFSLATAIKLSA